PGIHGRRVFEQALRSHLSLTRAARRAGNPRAAHVDPPGINGRAFPARHRRPALRLRPAVSGMAHRRAALYLLSAHRRGTRLWSEFRTVPSAAPRLVEVRALVGPDILWPTVGGFPGRRIFLPGVFAARHRTRRAQRNRRTASRRSIVRPGSSALP